MDNKSRIILAFIILFLFANPTFAISDDVLKKRIAQMIMVGFNGQTLRESNPIYSQVKDLGIGGVILFNRNADIAQPRLVKNIYDPIQLKKLTSDLQKIAPTPLFIAVDQEGGLVSRLSPSYFVVSTYSAKDLGTKNNLQLTYKEALKTAKTLNEVGINVNFAPCVDLEINKDSSIIAKVRRSYSDKPEIVISQAQQVIKAHNEYNVLPVIKHFPGHGSAAGDTHKGIVDVTDTYNKKELLPYRALIAQNNKKGVLVAHVFNKNFDSEMPSSMSKNVIDGLLKKDLGFNGIVFTDDIQMNAIRSNYTLEKTLLNAINAGNDVIIIGNNLSYEKDIAKDAIEIIFNLVKNNEIAQERIDESYFKILKEKRAE